MSLVFELLIEFLKHLTETNNNFSSFCKIKIEKFWLVSKKYKTSCKQVQIVVNRTDSNRLEISHKLIIMHVKDSIFL